MKKAFTLITISIFSLSASAQKGSWYLGGNVGFSSSQYKQTGGVFTNTAKNTSWSFSPEIGTFIKNNIQIGLGITLFGTKSNNHAIPTPTINKDNSYGGTVYTRKFWGKEAFKPFVGLIIQASKGKGTSRFGTVSFENKLSQFSANMNAGFSYALSKRVTALGSVGFLGYSSSVSEQTGSNIKNKNSSFGIDANSLGDRFNIGFYYTFHQ
jgi:hypothetical protein